MTVVIAAIGNDLIVVGADNRGVIKSGFIDDRIDNDATKKIFEVSKHVLITIAGNGDIGTQLIEKFKTKLKKGMDGATQIAENFAAFCKNEIYKNGYVPTKSIPDLDFIVTGFDKPKKEYNLPLIYTLDSATGFIMGRRLDYAIIGRYFIPAYLFKKEFRRNSDLQTLPKLVAKAIYETSQCDSTVSPNMHICIVEKNGIRELLSSVIKSLYSTWEELNLKEIIEN